MAYCPGCGASIEPDWRFCARCARPVVEDLTPTRSRRRASVVTPSVAADSGDEPSADVTGRWSLASLLILGAVVAGTSAYFPQYYSSGSRLGSSPESVWYNIPALTGWTLSAALLKIDRTTALGVGILFGVTTLWVPAYLPNIGDVLSGSQTPGGGFWLGMVSLALSLVGTLVAVGGAFTTRLILIRPRLSGTIWGMLASGVGVIYAVGLSLSWVQTDAHITQAGRVFTATGTPDLSVSCCTILDGRGWALANDVLTVLLVVAVPLLISVMAPTAAAVIGYRQETPRWEHERQLPQVRAQDIEGITKREGPSIAAS